jgi:N-methylhydantoinase B
LIQVGATDLVAIKILWARLMAFVDEAATAIVRTSFSHLVREMHDFSVSLYDEKGRLVATSTAGTPSLAGMLPNVVNHFLQVFDQGSLRAGDVMITNDPWIAMGHLSDLCVVEPVIWKDRVAGFAACAVHLPDVGGRGPSIAARDVFEEGLRLPPIKLMEGGRPNEGIWQVIRANVRDAETVVGDIRSQLAATHTLATRIATLLNESNIDRLSEISGGILDRTESLTREMINRIPDGSYRHQMLIDSYLESAEPVRLAVTVEVRGDVIHLDFTGTSPQVPWGINAPLNVIRGYGLFPLKCVLDPASPLNEGFMRPISVHAPVGSILNARDPAPVWGRMLTGYFLSELVFGALAAAVPDRVLAASGGTPQWLNFFDGYRAGGSRYLAVIVPQGGLGARSDKDGISTLAWPANLAMVPIEVLERDMPLICERMELVSDSGGPGRYRGGLGQELVLRITGDSPVHATLRGGRLHFPSTGILGGSPAPLGRLSVNSRQLNVPEITDLLPGDVITFRVAGGGGFYDAHEREPAAVAADVLNGYVSRAAAEREYGVAIGPEGEVDIARTQALRAANAPATGSPDAADAPDAPTV